MNLAPPLIAGATDWALFLDIDGTLLDLADTPQGVLVPPELPGLLQTLTQRLNGALALVSGRPLSDIDRFFPQCGDAAGTHGTQWRRGGVEQPSEPVDETGLAAAAKFIAVHCSRLPGLLLERKPHALALHYRQALARQQEAWTLARQVVQTLGPTFRLQPGKGVIEILPTLAGKGNAIRRFMRLSPYAGRCPVFVGDDLTDEDGFAAVNALGGWSIRVGNGAETQARFRLSSPTAVRDWLAGLV